MPKTAICSLVAVIAIALGAAISMNAQPARCAGCFTEGAPCYNAASCTGSTCACASQGDGNGYCIGLNLVDDSMTLLP